jgi:hypothetical protein
VVIYKILARTGRIRRHFPTETSICRSRTIIRSGKRYPYPWLKTRKCFLELGKGILPRSSNSGPGQRHQNLVLVSDVFVVVLQAKQDRILSVSSEPAAGFTSDFLVFGSTMGYRVRPETPAGAGDLAPDMRPRIRECNGTHPRISSPLSLFS